jgi:hypothetical protein
VPVLRHEFGVKKRTQGDTGIVRWRSGGVKLAVHRQTYSGLLTATKGNSRMEILGTVQAIQIQPMPLKTGEGAQRTYSPTQILPVAQLWVTPAGIMGITADGTEIMDVHHVQHPQTRFTAHNSLSFGFAHHYPALRARFGEHLTDGAAGENIRLTAAPQLDETRLSGARLAFRSAANGSLIEFTEVRVAVPCEPFSRFCNGGRSTAAEMKSALQFLDGGRRGYYATVASAAAAGFVTIGDTLVRL